MCFFLSFLDDFGSEKTKFSKHSTAVGCGFLQLIKSLYYINQTLCRVILPPFEKPFLSAGERLLK